MIITLPNTKVKPMDRCAFPTIVSAAIPLADSRTSPAQLCQFHLAWIGVPVVHFSRWRNPFRPA